MIAAGETYETTTMRVVDFPSEPRSTGRRVSIRARIGLGCRVVGALLALSLVTIGLFAALYLLAHALSPHWAFLTTPFTVDANTPDRVLTFSIYAFFHVTAPDLPVPHGPDRVLVWAEFALSWAWLLLVGSWAVAQWRALDDA